MDFRLKYSKKLFNLLYPFIGKKILISISDFQKYFNAQNMKTASAMIQKIVKTSKSEFEENEIFNFHFEVLKNKKSIEFFIFYPYNSEAIIFQHLQKDNEVKEENIKNNSPIENLYRKENLEEKFEIQENKNPDNSEFLKFENSQENDDIFQKKISQSEIEIALQKMKERRPN